MQTRAVSGLVMALGLCAFVQPLRALSREASDEFVVASYNIENYLGEETPDDAARHRAKPKSEKAARAVVRVVKDINPDILGVCEMGLPDEFETFKGRLSEAQLGYIDSEYVAGPDPDRHLALVTRFPIIARHSVANVEYELNGAPEKMKRGILDVTIRVTPAYDIRLVGVHLKSKLAAPAGEALVRRHEAELLRKHIDRILAEDPHVNLLVYGDLNDTRDQPALREVMGVRGSAGYLADLPAKDAFGDKWTEYWSVEDLYSRIDYFFANRAVLHEVVPGKTCVYRSEYWFEASDHRAIYTSIIPVNRAR